MCPMGIISANEIFGDTILKYILSIHTPSKEIHNKKLAEVCFMKNVCMRWKMSKL